MNNCWSNDLQKLTPYVPGESDPSDSFIKLNTNENPYGPSEKSLRAIRDVLGSQLRLYPDSDNIELISESPTNITLTSAQEKIVSYTFKVKNIFSGGHGGI